MYIDAPIVTVDPPESSHTVTVGTRLLLVCTATGQPIPLVQWFEGKTPATPIAQQFQQLLPVPTAFPYANRIYTCVGKSNAGNKGNIVRQQVMITVKGECIRTAYLLLSLKPKVRWTETLKQNRQYLSKPFLMLTM